MPEKTRNIGAVETTGRVLRSVRDLGCAGVTPIAEEADVSVSNAYKHLQTLCQEGLLAKDGEQYRLSAHLLHYADTVPAHIELLEFADRIEEFASSGPYRVTLFVREGDHVVACYCSSGTARFHDGERLPVWSSLPGLPVLTNLSPGERDDTLERARATKDAEHSPELEDRLTEIRSRGYAIQGVDDDAVPAVATHIPGPNGPPVGALDAELPADAQMNIGPDLSGLLTGLANDIYRSLLKETTV